MFASVLTCASIGIQAPPVAVEVHASNGLPALSVVGLPEASVRESKERVRSALINSGFQLPPKRITVNLAPADLPKSGGRYDLAIAIGILLATGQIEADVSGLVFLGELGLNGEIRAVPGVLPAILQVEDKTLIVPQANLDEAGLVLQDPRRAAAGQTVWGAPTLLQTVAFLLNKASLQEAAAVALQNRGYQADLADVVGQSQAKRVLEVSATGGHSILMVGPPGAGKSMLAQRLVTLLPDLDWQQASELAAVRSVAGQAFNPALCMQRPFVGPHHTASAAAMVGGGSVPRPGAISLAHHGVLFLDELPEFSRPVLEALREPLENRQVVVSRVNGQVIFPAKFLLVAAMNPSPSGYFPDDPLGRCKDTPDQINRYQRKISGPLLDRIDLHLEIPPVDIQALQKAPAASGDTSQTVRARVTRLHARQLARQGCLNSELTPVQLQQWVALEPAATALLGKAAEKMGISARSYHRILRVARTLADMADETQVKVAHIAEAIGYSGFDRQGRG